MIININNFSNQIEKIKNDIKEYEIKIYQTVSTAKNMSFYWNDGYTEAFFKKIDKEIQLTSDLINSLYRLLSLLTSISMIYSNINTRKSMILGYSSSVIDINDFIPDSDDDDDVAYKKRRLYNAVINAEDDISAEISGINAPYIEKIDFNNLYIEKNTQGFVGMLDGIDEELKRLEIEIESAINDSKVLKENLYSITTKYNSNNSNKIKRIINQLEDGLRNLNYNLEVGVNYIRNRKNAYKEMIAKIISETKKMEIDK